MPDFMTIYTFVIIALAGLLFGSFFNVCIYRIPAGKSVVSPPSSCGSCGHRLGPLDMVPVLSWLFSRGRCRYCGAKYSGRYALVEVLTALLFTLVFSRYPFQWDALFYIGLVSLLVIVSFIDIDHSIIPDGLVVIGLVMAAAFIAILHRDQWLNALLGMLCGAGPLFLIDFASRLILKKEGMGMGDVKTMAFVGLFLGWKLALFALLISVVAGGLFGGIALLSRKLKHGDYMPFGPFLSLGSILSLLWGTPMLNWYLGLFF